MQQEQTVNDFRNMFGATRNTTSVASAIKEAGLPEPKTESLFLIHLRNKRIFKAFKSIFSSIYHAIKNTFNAIYASIFAKETLPEEKVVKLNLDKTTERTSDTYVVEPNGFMPGHNAHMIKNTEAMGCMPTDLNIGQSGCNRRLSFN